MEPSGKTGGGMAHPSCRAAGAGPFAKVACLLLLSLSTLSAQLTIVLLRHAERRSKHPNASLTLEGHRRARALAEELAPLPPVALFATDHLRTQQTLGPLASRVDLTIQVRPRRATTALAAEVLSRYESGTVVICGHSDTLGPLASALGCPHWIPEVSDFDQLWFLRLGPRGFLGLEERRQKPPLPGVGVSFTSSTQHRPGTGERSPARLVRDFARSPVRTGSKHLDYRHFRMVTCWS